MSIPRTPKNLVKDFARQRQAKRRPPEGFSKAAKDIMGTRSGGRCEIDDCGPVFEWHHRGPRSAGGTKAEWVNRAANGLGLAALCHRAVELNRTAAYVNGWLVSRLGSKQASDVPVLYRGRWVLLADDGGVKPIEGGERE